jgi:hypothetical protein
MIKRSGQGKDIIYKNNGIVTIVKKYSRLCSREGDFFAAHSRGKAGDGCGIDAGCKPLGDIVKTSRL